MAYPVELLQLASELANFDSADSRQACLRRSVSTAYYALFLLLIAEAARNWAHPELRSDLSRVFEHGKMKSASADISRALSGLQKTRPLTETSANLLVVVDAFINLQQERHEADYDTGKTWNRIDVLMVINVASEAFASWKVIRDEPEAQAYLVSLFGKRRRSE